MASPPINTVEEWNDRLNPQMWPGAIDSHDSYIFGNPGVCRCCGMPGCCQPRLDCRSLSVNVIWEHFVRPPSSDSEPPLSDSTENPVGCDNRYRTEVQTITHTIDITNTFGTESDADTEISRHRVGSFSRVRTNTYAGTWVIGDTSNMPRCSRIYQAGTSTTTCVATGSYTDQTWSRYYDEETDTMVRYLAEEISITVGDHKPEGEDMDASNSDSTDLAGPCCYWVNSVRTVYYPPGGPSPEVTTESFLSENITSIFSGGTYTEVYTYAGKMSHAAFLSAMADALASLHIREATDDGNGHDSVDELGCRSHSLCSARNQLWSCFYVKARVFKYRWKLDRCCEDLQARLEWQKVSFPQAYLDWLSLPGSEQGSAPPAVPTATSQVWEWTGEPDTVGCHYSTSDIAADFPYDNPAKWSPWSPVVIHPGLGLTELRNGFNICYDSIYGSGASLIEDIAAYNPNDLNNDGLSD